MFKAILNLKKDIDKRIVIENKLSKVRDRFSHHILIVKDVLEPFSGILELQTYISKNGFLAEAKKIPIRINIKYQPGCAENNQPVCGKLLFS